MKHAAEHMNQKNLKGSFSLRLKILHVNVMNNPLNLKLFDTLIQPILTYGSEIWVTNFKIKENTLDKCPFEKTTKQIM